MSSNLKKLALVSLAASFLAITNMSAARADHDCDGDDRGWRGRDCDDGRYCGGNNGWNNGGYYAPRGYGGNWNNGYGNGGGYFNPYGNRRSFANKLRRWLYY